MRRQVDLMTPTRQKVSMTRLVKKRMHLSNHVGTREQNGERRYDGEERECDQTQSIDYHSGKPPIVDLWLYIFVNGDLIRQLPQLNQYVRQ